MALCYDAHHEAHLQKVILERSVEALVSGTTIVLKDDDLAARPIELKLASKPTKQEKEGPRRRRRPREGGPREGEGDAQEEGQNAG